VLAAVIMLAYALAPYINAPDRTFVLPLPGYEFPITFNLGIAVSYIVGGLSAVGTDWLIRDHPHLPAGQTYVHWILPALTAWAIGIPLNSLELGLQWWAVFTLGGVLLIMVLVAEYIVIDLSDANHALATIGLTAVAFALYLVLAISVRSAGLRLYLLLPALMIPMTLVSLRTFYLRFGGEWYPAWAVGVGIFIGEFAVGLHYLPLTPLAYGLLLLGVAYALTSIVGSIIEVRPLRSMWIEPTIMLTVLWGLAFILGG
jgi:hypothetical protein